MQQDALHHQLNHLLAEGREHEVVEFKEAKIDYHFDKIGRYFSALCNEANLKGRPCAWLVFGVADKGKQIVGSQYRQQSKTHLDKLKKDVADKTTGSISFLEIYEVQRPEGRVVMFQIPAAPQGVPVAWEGHYYGRDGESLGALSLEEMERIRRQVAHMDWSAATIDGATIDDLDPAAIQFARSEYAKKNRKLEHEIVHWNDEVFLRKTKLMVGGKLTRTAILLLGLPESDYLIQPAQARITWQLRSAEGANRDYEHFGCPFLLAIDGIYAKIRNLKYRYMKVDSLFPEEVLRYEMGAIRELINNCIAHQDYTKAERINVVEYEDDRLLFSNAGEFLAGSVETVLHSQEPPRFYRNNHLCQAMVALNMIDTIGSGIQRVFEEQRKRFFPLPDYDLTAGNVRAELTGKVLDMEYAQVLARNPQLSLEEIIMLDKVQKGKSITEEETQILRRQNLIEGKKPNWIISAKVAQTTKQVATYLRMRGENTDYCKQKVLELIHLNKSGTDKKEIRELLRNKLPEQMNEQQRENRISYIVRRLREEGKIHNAGTDSFPNWVPV